MTNDLAQCKCGNNGIVRCSEDIKDEKGTVVVLCMRCGLRTKPIEFYGRDMRGNAYSIARKRWNALQG